MQNKMDFTLSAYKQLISTLQFQGYFFQTFEEYIQNPREKVLILRHDVDRLPWNALVIAKIEKEAGIRASYYFRIVSESYDENIIRQIAEMGHEIGYHYENLAEISKKSPQISQINADYLISRRRTRTDADIYPADLAGQKESSLREKKPKRWRNDPHPRGIRSDKLNALRCDSVNLTRQAVTSEFHRAGISQINADEGKEEFRDEFFELALDDFGLNLEKFRKLYPVKTICMHGGPLSKWDNRD